MKASLFLAPIAFALVDAQVAAYGQCGGSVYSGVTNCVTGYYCLSQNAFYFQCVPGTATAAATSTKASSTLVTTTKSSTVTSSTKTSSSSTVPRTSTSTTSTKASSSSSSSKASSSSTKSSSTGVVGTSTFTAYAKATGHVFSINGKAPAYWMGTNSYWIGFLTNNADVDLVMSHLASTGLKVLRVWGFNDVTSTPGSGTVWYQSFVSGASPVINTGANGLQRLDYVVASAEAHGISLIINFVNNWTDYGGMQAYCTYYGISPVTNWYTNTLAQTQYKAYIQAVVSRYTTSKAIFAWELANEPRCSGCDSSVITNWITTISAYIKSLDSNHMVCIGDEGFGLSTGSDGSYPYTLGPGTNFTTNLAISTIDFGTFHLYTDSWGQTTAWGNTWVSNHAAAAAAIGKPVIFEEYGSTTKSNLVGWQAASLASVVAGDMYWQYGDTLSTGVTSDDGNTIFYGSSDYATYVTAHAAALNAKVV